MTVAASFDVKIALLGHVSVGKTTILNALLCGKFSEVSKRRTTAGVNHFRISSHYPENDTLYKSSETLEKIIIENQRLRGEEKIEEYTFAIQFEDEILFQSSIPGAQLRFILSDFPGMNEAKTSQLYTDFVKNAWDTFDCVIVVMDACQGVNTEEQIELLKFVKTCNQVYKDIPIIILCNKVDDEADGEIMSLVQEVRKEVEAIFEVGDRKGALESILSGLSDNTVVGGTEISPIFMHISAENAFVYRTASKLTKDTLHQLEKASFDKIGHEEVGKMKWNRLSNDEKLQVVINVVSDPDQYRDRLESSNCDKLLKVLEHIMGGQEKQQTIIEKQIQVILKKLSSSIDFMTSLSDLCNLQMNLKKPVDGIIEKFWYLFEECKTTAVENFEESPWTVKDLAHPMKQLICFHNFLKTNTRFKDSMTLVTWTENIKRAKESMIDLICEQLSIIFLKLTCNQDCGKCDLWTSVSFESHSHSDRVSSLAKTHLNLTTTSIWSKAGSSALKILASHPDPMSKSSIKDDNKWEGLSRREKVAICHSILLFKHDKLFCQTFGYQIIRLEGILHDIPSECKCYDNNVNKRMMIPFSFSSENHWAHLVWQFCQNECDDETITLSYEVQAKRFKQDTEFSKSKEIVVSVDAEQVASNGALQSNDETITYNFCGDDSDSDCS